MQLYSYFRSSTSFRVRIALNFKELPYKIIPVNLRENEHQAPAYLAINPQGLVPTLIDQGQTLTQSMAILEYLEECYPTPPLLPGNSIEKAHVRSLTQLIASDIHPLNNLRVLIYLQQELNVSENQKNHWYNHWITKGFQHLEKLLHPTADNFCFGGAPSLADACLIPQIYNAIRFQVDLSSFPTLSRIYTSCLMLPAFANALPENQPDCVI